MEIKCIGIESRHRQIAPDASRHLIRQVTEVRVLMQLPNAIEIASPGAALIGIAGGVTAHRQERLQLSRQIQRVKSEAIRCNNGGEQMVQLHGQAMTPPPHPRSRPLNRSAIKKPALGPAKKNGCGAINQQRQHHLPPRESPA